MSSRIHIIVRGAVQGVGFRPFIYRIASELTLNGYVFNSPEGVFIEAEGNETLLRTFLSKIEKEKPSLAFISSLEFSFLDLVGYKNFEIKESNTNGNTNTLILPDIAVCSDCLRELFDQNDRRYLYPFINCTHCGPRFSIVEKLPYDRQNTSMKKFELCSECKKEFHNPSDRRFHAQPIACPACGPNLELWNNSGEVIAVNHEALLETCDKIEKGFIIALKGLGGFQLIVDANNSDSVKRLRNKKKRDEKPFALMFPNLSVAKEICNLSHEEERSLLSPEAPIVLLKRKPKRQTQNISEFVALSNPMLGIMLPYTPLHHLLMKKFSMPIVATSGNLSEEPICIDEYEALSRLKSIADFYLTHNRPIVRHVDDSIVRIINCRQMILRRARGYAPLPIQIQDKLARKSQKTILAVGGHLKNTIALKIGKNVFISQHIGDLSTEESNKAFKKTIADFKNLYKAEPECVIADLHPHYISTRFAKTLDANIEMVQHHFAHIAACRLENQIEGEVLGVSWDGTGYGLDKSVWGGEFFVSTDETFKHIGQFKKFLLPGSETAIKEPKRTAVSLLYEVFKDSLADHLPQHLKDNFTAGELNILNEMLKKKINSPNTSSAGRIFDGVSSLLGICHKSNYEGQAAMMLEFAACENVFECYPFNLYDENIFVVDWSPMIKSILEEIQSGVLPSTISSKFHNTLAQMILSIAVKVGISKIVLSGGCFQNAFLTERTIKLLNQNNFKVYWHQRIPPNDGGISVGQIAVYLLSQKETNKNETISPTIEQSTLYSNNKEKK